MEIAAGGDFEALPPCYNPICGIGVHARLAIRMNKRLKCEVGFKVP